MNRMNLSIERLDQLRLQVEAQRSRMTVTIDPNLALELIARTRDATVMAESFVRQEKRLILAEQTLNHLRAQLRELLGG